MNLHAIANPVVQAVNPNLTVTLQVSTGNTINSDFSTTPTFATYSVSAQIQAMSNADIRHIDALNIQGNFLTAYFFGVVAGLDRPAGKGGDLITLPDGRVFLVSVVLEPWDESAGWTKVALVEQTSPVQ